MDRANGLRVFFSYSHRDERYLDQLRKHLANLEQEGLVRLWHDRAIRPGEEWEPAIAAQLDQADVIVLLISADFNASNFCRRVEMACAVERHRQSGGGDSRGRSAGRGVAPRNRPSSSHPPRPETDRRFPAAGRGYVQVARGIRRVLEEFVQQDRTDASSKRDVAIEIPGTGPVTVFCEFQASGDGYKLAIHVGFDQRADNRVARRVRLGRSETLRLGGGVQATLGEIVARLVDGEREELAWFEERGQLEIGRKLFEETVGRLEPLANCDQVDLRIVTDDETCCVCPGRCSTAGASS